MSSELGITLKDKNESMTLPQLLKELYIRLVPIWPDTRPLLHYRSCFELLIAVILSAQTTDDQVNIVTKELFRRFPNAESLADANIHEVENIIHSLGFYRVKAKHIIETAKVLKERFNGQIPSSFEEMIELPGVGRKSANLLISACYEKPGIIVDTHVIRVLFRLGVSTKKEATLIESIIRANLPPEKHTKFSHAVNRHGKFTCTARKPVCTVQEGYCPVVDLCPKIGLSNLLKQRQ